DRTHGGFPIGKCSTRALQFATVELPNQHSIIVAAECYLLDRHVHMLALPMAAASKVGAERSCSGDHVRVKCTRVTCLFYRWPVRFAGHPQCPAHCRSDEFAAAPAATRARRAECSN